MLHKDEGKQPQKHLAKKQALPVAVNPGPLAVLENLRNQMDNFFAQGWSRWPSLLTTMAEGADWSPRINAFRTNGDLVVKADLPGLAKEDIHVTLEEGDLVLEGERKQEMEAEENGFYRCESTFGSFYRRLPLDFPVKAEQVKAKFDNGVLEVRLPVPPAPEAEARPIPVK